MTRLTGENVGGPAVRPAPTGVRGQGRRRPAQRFVAGAIAILAAIWVVPGALRASPDAQGRRALLWVVEESTPTYLFGTIHVPDERVADLAPQVEQALARADALLTEIPMDPATQMSVMRRVLLPGDQRLADIVGAPLVDRLGKAVARALPAGAPPGTAAMLTSMLGRMKPWAAMTQLSQLEFLPDLLAGRQPLDLMLWSRAQKAGKETGALETVEEQVGVFERFTAAEQKRMLELSLDALEQEAASSGPTPARQLIDAYLTGDLAQLTRVMSESMKSDPDLHARFTALALDARNRVMVTRIKERRAAQPGKVLFVAVGAAHYPGDAGILALLQKDGFSVRRVGP
jgi:uncharacterized protein